MKDSDNLPTTMGDHVRMFNPLNEYKEDYRLNSRYYDIELSMIEGTNPSITGFDVDVDGGGRR